jgi:hypothetical protein
MKKFVLLIFGLFILLLSISAGCAYTTRNFDSEGHKSISDKDELQLTDSYLTTYTIRDKTYFGGALVGHVKNNSGRTFHNVKMKVNLYFGGSQIGSTMGYIDNLEPGGIWAFRISSAGAGEYADDYKVIEISGS